MSPDPPESSVQLPRVVVDPIERVTKGAEREPGFLLVLARQAALPSERKLAAFAEALHLDPFTARQWLLAPTPRVIRRETQQARALEWVSWLRAIGVRAFDLPEALLAEQEFSTPAVVQTEPDGLSCEAPDGSLVQVPFGDLICGVWGETREKLQTETTAQGMAGEVFAGRQSRVHSEWMLDLHRRNSPVTIRLAQDSIRWSALYPDETGQSAMMMKRLGQQLRRSLPGLPFHEEFGKAEAVLGASRELIQRSSYLVTRWLTSGGRLQLQRDTVIRDSTRETFSIYSTLLRWEALRISRSSDHTR